MAAKSKYLNFPIEAADHRKLKLLCLHRDCTLKSILQEIVHEEMETAKGTDLPDLLEHLGYTVRRLGSRYHTTREMDSLRIKDRRTWKRYSNGTGGDAITFLQEFCGKDFREAVNYLLEFNGGRARDSPIPHPRPAQAKENLVPGALSGGLVNQVGSANLNGGTAGSSVVPGEYPSVSGGSNVTMTQIPGGSPTDIAQGNTTGGYTEVTDDLYYSNGSLKDRAPPQTNSHRRSRQIHRRQKSRQSSLHPMTRFHGNAPGSKHGKLFLPGRAAQALGRPLGSG